MSVYNKVLIIVKPKLDTPTALICEKIIIYCDENDIRWSFNDMDYVRETKTLIIAVGGDGTMLGAMRDALNHPNAIVYGINTGTLGFLSEGFPDNIPMVMDNIQNRNGMVEERMGLSARIFVDGELNTNDLDAMNDFVLAPISIQSPSTTEIYINKRFVSKNVGSGALVATSTGSTAMSLSAGGAIVSPSTDIMQVVPIMPHTLTSRPVITSGRDMISLKTYLVDSKNPIEIYGDGIVLGTFYPGDGNEIELRVNKHPSTVPVFRPSDWDFFNVLREKMKW